MRIIAALLVAGYHAWSGRVSGGVDVFFVMSGFLISTTLLSQLNSFGRVRPGIFLGRLALRLLPAALTTLVTVLVASFLFLPDLLWERIGHEVRASALYIENWYLAATSTDYFGGWQTKTPVQHFWALSVQGQFYLTWIVVFSVVAVLIRRYPERAVGLVVGGLASVFVPSLIFSIWFTEHDQAVAYFATPARAWEFALGGLAAVVLRNPPRSRSWLRWSLGWIGLAILLTTGLLLQVSTVFPGYAALLPTSAALMILLSARNGIGFGADALLSTKTLVWLGGISYGIYLWHYPLLKFYRSLTDQDTNGLASGLAIIASAVALAFLTQRLVERPLLGLARRSAQARRVVVGGLVTALIGIVVTAGTFTAPGTGTADVNAVRAATEELGEKAYDLEPCTGALAGPPTSPGPCQHKTKAFVTPVKLIPSTQQSIPCEKTFHEGLLTVCAGGSTSERPRATALLIGDSHSLTMRPALDLVAKHHDWRLLFAYGPGCQTAAVPKAGTTAERCEQWLDQLTDYLESTPVDVLFAIQAAGHDFEGIPREDTERIAQAYRKQWDRYADLKQLVVIHDTPRLSDTLLTCLGRHRPADAAVACSRLRTTALKPDAAALAARTDRDDLTRVVDLSDVFCDDERCYPVIGDFIAYRDAVHLHTGFVPTLTPVLDDAIRSALTPEVRELLYGPTDTANAAPTG